MSQKLNESPRELSSHQCQRCGGSGLMETVTIYCSRCQGKKCGRCPIYQSGYAQLPMSTCSLCQGTGVVNPHVSVT